MTTLFLNAINLLSEQTQTIANGWEPKIRIACDAIIDIKSSGKGVEFTQASGQTARFAIHWKNVAQGVQTPCFNVWY